MRDASEWAVVLVNDVFSETGDKPVTREVMEREDRPAYRALVDTVSRIQSDARADVLALRSRVRELEGRLAEASAALWSAGLPLAANALLYGVDEKHLGRAALPSQEQPAAPPTSTPEAPRPPSSCDQHWPSACTCKPRLVAAPSTPEGEPADDDADPEAWAVGDTIAVPNFNDTFEWGSRHKHDEDTKRRARRFGWRRIRRSPEAGTDERRG